MTLIYGRNRTKDAIAFTAISGDLIQGCTILKFTFTLRDSIATCNP
ncbi:hypothetical protein NDA04_05320 [Trichocoleus sp. AS-A2]